MAGVVADLLPAGQKKEGGAYVAATGALKKIDDYERVFVFMDGKNVSIEGVLESECEMFGMLNK